MLGRIAGNLAGTAAGGALGTKAGTALGTTIGLAAGGPVGAIVGAPIGAAVGGVAGGLAGGAAGETFVADVEKIGSFGDAFEFGPTQLNRETDLDSQTDATRKLLLTVFVIKDGNSTQGRRSSPPIGMTIAAI